MSINRVSIAGYLTRDAELRTVNGNLAVLGFTVAINEKRKDRGSGQYVDAPVFVRCAVFGQRAEHLARYMTKGTKVMIDGRLHYSSYMKDDEQRHDDRGHDTARRPSDEDQQRIPDDYERDEKDEAQHNPVCSHTSSS